MSKAAANVLRYANYNIIFDSREGRYINVIDYAGNDTFRCEVEEDGRELYAQTFTTRELSNIIKRG